MSNSGSGPLSGSERNSNNFGDSLIPWESLTWLTTCFGLLLINFSQRVADYKTMAGDMGLYLQCGQLLLSGQRPYVDFFDTNPPLIMYLSMLPAFLHATISGDVVFWFQICMLALSMFVMAGLAVLLYQSELKRLIFPALACISLMSMMSMFDYGQREYIFFLLFLPYFFFCLVRSKEKAPGKKWYMPLAITFGIAAGIGFSLKPHFLIFLLFLEGWTAKNCGLSYLKYMLRPELLACIFTGLVYALHFLFLPSDIKFGFFDQLMPMMVNGFAAFDADKPFFLSSLWASLTIYSLIAIVLSIVYFKKMQLAFPLLLMLISSILLILIQAKNWSYYGIPLLGFSTLTYLFLLFNLNESTKTRITRYLFLFVCVIYSVGQLFWMNKVASAMDFRFAPVVRKYASAKDKVLYLDTTSCPWYAFAAHDGIMPACRYLWLFPITMSEYELSLKKNERIKPALLAREDEAIKNILKDAQKNKPPLIVCRKNRAYKMPEQFNLFEFLNQRGLAPLFAQYKLQHEDSDFVYLTINPISR
jgi:hypothetical protein